MPMTTYINDNEFCNPVSSRELNELLTEVNKIFNNKYKLQEIKVESGYLWNKKEKSLYYLYYELIKPEYQIINLRNGSLGIVESYFYGLLNGYNFAQNNIK